MAVSEFGGLWRGDIKRFYCNKVMLWLLIFFNMSFLQRNLNLYKKVIFPELLFGLLEADNSLLRS